MTTKTVYQIDNSGLYVGETVADESPLEPGVFHMPAKTVAVPPPADVPADHWPRWNGSAWVLAKNVQQPANDNDPVAKMKLFLEQNPDVAEYLAAKQRSV
jgi:hypothetical protein